MVSVGKTGRSFETLPKVDEFRCLLPWNLLTLRIIGPPKKEGFESVWRRARLDLQSPPVTWDPGWFLGQTNMAYENPLVSLNEASNKNPYFVSGGTWPAGGGGPGWPTMKFLPNKLPSDETSKANSLKRGREVERMGYELIKIHSHYHSRKTNKMTMENSWKF